MIAATSGDRGRTTKRVPWVSLHGNSLASLFGGERAIDFRVLGPASLMVVRADEPRPDGLRWSKADLDLASARPCGWVDGSPALSVPVGGSDDDGLSTSVAFRLRSNVGETLAVKEPFRIGLIDRRAAVQYSWDDATSFLPPCDAVGMASWPIADAPWKAGACLPDELSRLTVRVVGARLIRLQDVDAARWSAQQERMYAARAWTRTGASRPIGTDRELFEQWWLAGPGAPQRVSGNTKGDWYVSHPLEDVQEVRVRTGLPWFVRGNPWLVETEYEAVKIARHLHRVACAPCA